MNKPVTEKTPKAIDDLEEVNWETLHQLVRGGIDDGARERADRNHDKRRQAG
jgi:hypothetical protein